MRWPLSSMLAFAGFWPLVTHRWRLNIWSKPDVVLVRSVQCTWMTSNHGTNGHGRTWRGWHWSTSYYRQFIVLHKWAHQCSKMLFSQETEPHIAKLTSCNFTDSKHGLCQQQGLNIFYCELLVITKKMIERTICHQAHRHWFGYCHDIQ